MRQIQNHFFLGWFHNVSQEIVSNTFYELVFQPTFTNLFVQLMSPKIIAIPFLQGIKMLLIKLQMPEW